MADRVNYITPNGFEKLKSEYERLFGKDRPALVEVINWAAGNGDRSENGDYIYGRKKLREIDRRLTFLSRRMKAAQIVDPAAQPDKDRIYFGATVTLIDEDDDERIVTLVGEDEANATAGKISWVSPMANALKRAVVGDNRTVRLPAGPKNYEIREISYPSPEYQ